MKTEKHMSRRYVLFALVTVAAFAVLIFGLYRLQISNAEQYQSAAGNQKVLTRRLTGMRGMITDADSVVLAMSEPTYNVTFYRTDKQNSAKQYAEFTKAILQTIEIVENHQAQLSVKTIFEKDPDTGAFVFNFGKGVSQRALDIRENIWRSNHYLGFNTYPTAQACYDALITRYQLTEYADEEELCLKVIAVYTEMQNNVYNSVPVIIAKDIPFAAVSEIIGRKMELTGMDIEVGEKRVYPRGTLASQVIGYVGPIAERDNYATEYKPLGYALNDVIGKDGVERSMENWLTANITSRQGSRVMERDNVGSLTREISMTEPENGNNVKLSLIASYQQAAERAIADNVMATRKEQERRMFLDRWREDNRLKLEQRDFDQYPLQLADTGAMVVLDINTGRVLAMAQYPTYDLNALVAGGQEAVDILLDERNVLNNYCIQSRAEPGSIFKMVPAMAAMTNGVLGVTETISDAGPFKRYTNRDEDAPVCWIPKGQRGRHADLNIVGGISNSCNYFFYEITARLYGDTGSNLLYKYAAQMGLTTKTGIQLPGEMRSVVGCQTSLYDPTVSINEQETFVPMLVAASIKKHIRNFGSSYGIDYDDVRLDTAIKRLMDMALNEHSDRWSDAMRPILMAELNMTRDMVYRQALIGEIWRFLNDIKWGGGLEVQMGIGQSITLLTPVAVSRYVASLGNGGTVYNLSIVDSVISPDGDILNESKPSVFGQLEDAYLYLPYIKEGMKGVVDDNGTAGRRFDRWEYKNDVWGKTGSSQVTIGGIKIDLENNGWFVLLAPFKTDAEIAVIVHVPNGLSGAESSAAARSFISWWMNNKAKTSDDTPVAGGNELMN